MFTAQQYNVKQQSISSLFLIFIYKAQYFFRFYYLYSITEVINLSLKLIWTNHFHQNISDRTASQLIFRSKSQNPFKVVLPREVRANERTL